LDAAAVGVARQTVQEGDFGLDIRSERVATSWPIIFDEIAAVHGRRLRYPLLVDTLGGQLV
jgi:hypothetical protein